MESINLGDGLVLTVVSMLLVFLVLAAIWLLIELVAKFVHEPESTTEKAQGATQQPTDKELMKQDLLQSNSDYQFVAEMMALVLASEGQTDRKFEVVKSERIK